MAKEIRVDIRENRILELDSTLLNILLKDNSSGQNIIWATDDYTQYDSTHTKDRQITVFSVTGKNGMIIKPRVEKTTREQLARVRDKAEVFTPSWICNKQNNLVDNAWFGSENIFNTEQEKTWIATDRKIPFPTADGKTWQDYVKANRLEISCGEAPYLASRYDTVSGNVIPVKERIGLRGWINYYRKSSMKARIEKLSAWLRNAIRVVIWKQWKLPSTRTKALIKLGLSENEAKCVSNSRKGYQHICHCWSIQKAITNSRLKKTIMMINIYFLSNFLLTFKISFLSISNKNGTS